MNAALTLLVPLVVMGVLALVLRWAFSSDTDQLRHKDYGLLREVAIVPSRRAARIVEERLRRVGVRATTVPTDDGERLRIMVFPADEQLAIRTLLADED